MNMHSSTSIYRYSISAFYFGYILFRDQLSRDTQSCCGSFVLYSFYLFYYNIYNALVEKVSKQEKQNKEKRRNLVFFRMFGTTNLYMVGFMYMALMLLSLFYWLHELSILNQDIRSHNKKDNKELVEEPIYHGSDEICSSYMRPRKSKSVFTSVPKLMAVLVYGAFIFVDLAFLLTLLAKWIPRAIYERYDRLYGSQDSPEIQNINASIQEQELSFYWLYLYLGLTAISLFTPMKRIYLVEGIMFLEAEA